MKNCPYCNTPLEDNASFCPSCGNQQPPLNAQQPQQPYQQPVPYPTVDPHDHTADFSPEDIAENKLFAMIVYLLGPIGVIIALLANKESPFLRFHLRQSLKLLIAETITVLATVVLSWTLIAAAAGGIFIFILAIVEIICFVQAAKGQAKDAAIIREWKFLN